MTTTITPAAGAGILFTQRGTGTTPGYAALDDRRSNLGNMQEGVYGTSTLVSAGGVSNVANADFMVTQRAAGANQSVDINMPAGGFAYVQGDTINGQSLYTVPVHSANINEVVTAADPTNPRVDQAILEIQDDALDASGGNQARTRILTGTPTAAASLTNRSGATALPGSALLLADILVPAASSSVPNSNIRDRRKWARGAYSRISRNTSTYAITSATPALIDGTNLNPRFECSGVPVRATLRLANVSTAVATTLNAFEMFLDSALLTDGEVFWVSPASTATTGEIISWEFVPAAGSHLIGPAFAGDGTHALTIAMATATPLIWTVEEIVKSNAQNSNGVTTG